MKAPDAPSSDKSRLPDREAFLVEEVPLAIAVNDISLVVMMVSPHDIEDFIIGYFVTEQIIVSAREVKDIEIRQHSQGLIANVQLTGRREYLLKSRRHNVVSAGCGICNHTALENAFPSLEANDHFAPLPDCDYASLRDEMNAIQQKGRISGALHAAMYCEKSHTPIGREDVGRHNALDKVIGAVMQQRTGQRGGYLVVTSRCGVELVQKAVVAGFGTLISFSSPTSLAVSFARQHKLNLVFLPRNNQPIFFSHEVQHDR